MATLWTSRWVLPEDVEGSSGTDKEPHSLTRT